MIPMLRTAALLCAGPLTFLLAGVLPVLRTGQVDIGGWAWPALILVAAAGVLKARRSDLHAIWAGLGSLAVLGTFVWLATGRMPDPGGLVILVCIIVLTIAGGVYLLRNPWLGLVCCGLAVLLCWLTADRPLGKASQRPSLAVVSGLPLFWREGKSDVEARADAPIITILRQYFDVVPLDSPISLTSGNADALLLAQPRLLPPEELLAVDTWVRGGARALILVDPLLRWPSVLPTGDRRRPPSISLLTPLLAHWGVNLRPPSSLGEKRQTLADGRLLTTIAASTFQVRTGSSCKLLEGGLIVSCVLGKGRATLIADADLIDDRLWLSDERTALNPRAWTADTAAFVLEQLGRQATEPRLWITSVANLQFALRWAILAGIFWALLGCAISARVQRSGIGPTTPAPGRRNGAGCK